MKALYILPLSILMTIIAVGQTTNITIGNGTQSNSSTNYPAPYGNWYWGAKHQIIITVSELNSAGMTAGDIYGLSFDVDQANSVTLEDFVIRIGHTSLNEFQMTTNFATGLTQVFGPQNYTESNGLNTHTFSSPFTWNGVDNLVIETCFNNSSYTANASMFFTQASGNVVKYEIQDASNVCSVTNSNLLSDLRPNIILEWQVPNLPPVTDFVANPTNTCSGDVSFTDNSSNNPTSWLWDFGDGNTSTLQNPSHTYSATGNYTVSLTASNTFGTDSETKTSYVNVNLSGNAPAAATCSPSTGDGSLGFGITNVTFNGINKNSGDAAEGYSDFTCDQTTVYAGQSYTFSATHSAPTTHSCAAWIDWNNDGVFSSSEEIAQNASSLSTNATVTIPSNSVLNTPLRLRVIADYDLNGIPSSCTNPGYGQCEDYTIIVEQLALPPDADFTSNITYTCDGTVSFTDLSTNIPNAWSWDFGDGGTSIMKNPTHTYTTDGIYEVELIAINNFGSNTVVKTNYIEVNSDYLLTQANCEPSTLSHCCDYGIYNVSMNTINYSSIGAEEGYQDFSCMYNTTLSSGMSYPITVRTGTQNPQDTKVWIDFNNDGIFDNNSESVFTSFNSYNPSGNISIPSTGVVFDTYLRMRISSEEVGGTLDGCDNLLRGQTEDYGVLIENVSGVNENSISDVLIYPNPSNGIFNLQSSDKINSIQVYDMIGKLVFSQDKLISSKLDLSQLDEGSYLITLWTEVSATTQKIIIK